MTNPSSIPEGFNYRALFLKSTENLKHITAAVTTTTTVTGGVTNVQTTTTCITTDTATTPSYLDGLNLAELEEMDTNHDGYLTKAEFEKAIKSNNATQYNTLTSTDITSYWNGYLSTFNTYTTSNSISIDNTFKTVTTVTENLHETGSARYTTNTETQLVGWIMQEGDTAKYGLTENDDVLSNEAFSDTISSIETEGKFKQYISELSTTAKDIWNTTWATESTIKGQVEMVFKSLSPDEQDQDKLEDLILKFKSLYEMQNENLKTALKGITISSNAETNNTNARVLNEVITLIDDQSDDLKDFMTAFGDSSSSGRVIGLIENKDSATGDIANARFDRLLANVIGSNKRAYRNFDDTQKAQVKLIFQVHEKDEQDIDALKRCIQSTKDLYASIKEDTEEGRAFKTAVESITDGQVLKNYFDIANEDSHAYIQREFGLLGSQYQTKERLTEIINNVLKGDFYEDVTSDNIAVSLENGFKDLVSAFASPTISEPDISDADWTTFQEFIFNKIGNNQKLTSTQIQSEINSNELNLTPNQKTYFISCMQNLAKINGTSGDAAKLNLEDLAYASISAAILQKTETDNKTALMTSITTILKNTSTTMEEKRDAIKRLAGFNTTFDDSRLLSILTTAGSADGNLDNISETDKKSIALGILQSNSTIDGGEKMLGKINNATQARKIITDEAKNMKDILEILADSTDGTTFVDRTIEEDFAKAIQLALSEIVTESNDIAGISKTPNKTQFTQIIFEHIDGRDADDITDEEKAIIDAIYNNLKGANSNIEPKDVTSAIIASALLKGYPNLDAAQKQFLMQKAIEKISNGGNITDIANSLKTDVFKSWTKSDGSGFSSNINASDFTYDISDIRRLLNVINTDSNTSLSAAEFKTFAQNNLGYLAEETEESEETQSPEERYLLAKNKVKLSELNSGDDDTKISLNDTQWEQVKGLFILEDEENQNETTLGNIIESVYGVYKEIGEMSECKDSFESAFNGLDASTIKKYLEIPDLRNHIQSRFSGLDTSAQTTANLKTIIEREWRYN